MTVDRVRVTNLVKRFGHHRALGGVDLTLEQGSVCALLGPNGAGKSTLLGVISTLVAQTSGEVIYEAGGKAVPAGPELRRHIGVLAHEAFVYAELSAIENLAFYAELYGLDDVAGRSKALLDEVALETDARDRPARTFSRGMLQRLALARALLHDPSVLLLDEPFTGLDRTGAAALAKTIALAKARGRVVLVITHDFDAIADVTDHVVVIRRGRIAHQERNAAGFDHAALKDVYFRHCDG